MTTTHVSLVSDSLLFRDDVSILCWCQKVVHSLDDAESPTRKRAKYGDILEESAPPEEPEHRSSDTPATSTSNATSQGLANQDSGHMGSMSNATFEDTASRDSGMEDDDDKISTESFDTSKADTLRLSVFPTFPLDQDMDFAHLVNRYLFKEELCSTTISHHSRILDIGSGNGLWANEMGKKYPSATILGLEIDIENIPNIFPVNVEFSLGNLVKDCSLGESYDFIYVRDMAGWITDWGKALERCFQHLKPGGSIEITTYGPALRLHRENVTSHNPIATEQTTAAHSISSEAAIHIQDTATRVMESFKTWSLEAGQPLVPNIKDCLNCAGFATMVQDLYYVPLMPSKPMEVPNYNQLISRIFYSRLRDSRVGLQDKLEKRLDPLISLDIKDLADAEVIDLEVVVIRAMKK